MHVTPSHLLSREHKAIVTTLIPEFDAEGDRSDPLVSLGSIITVQPVCGGWSVCVCVCAGINTGSSISGSSGGGDQTCSAL